MGERQKKVDKRRRREGKTNYLIRIKLLKGKKPRVVFRKTNKYILSQYVVSKGAQDNIIIGTSSKELMNFGLSKESKVSLKSITAAYLTGVLMGVKIKEKKLETPIMDMGMLRVTHKTKPYAFIKGLKDAGMNVNCDEECFPEEGRIKGESLKNKINFEEIKSKIMKK